MELNISVKTDSFVDASGKSLDRSFSGKDSLKMLMGYLQSVLVAESKAQLAKAKSENFFPNDKYVTIVDNVTGKAVENVKPLGKVEYVSPVAASQLFVKIYQGLLDRSRVDSGLYRTSHYVYHNGTLVATTIQALRNYMAKNPNIRTGDTIRFVNVTPYAGKLEREGITAGRVPSPVWAKAKDKRQRSGALVRKPNGTYFLTQRAISRDFKNNAGIRYEWINGSSISSLPALRHPRKGYLLRRTFHPKSNRKGSYVYPSIVVRIGKDGGVI